MKLLLIFWVCLPATFAMPWASDTSLSTPRHPIESGQDRWPPVHREQRVELPSWILPTSGNATAIEEIGDDWAKDCGFIVHSRAINLDRHDLTIDQIHSCNPQSRLDSEQLVSVHYNVQQLRQTMDRASSITDQVLTSDNLPARRQLLSSSNLLALGAHPKTELFLFAALVILILSAATKLLVKPTRDENF